MCRRPGLCLYFSAAIVLAMSPMPLRAEGKVHAIVVIDTADADLKVSVNIDRKRMLTLLDSVLGSDCKTVVVTGGDVASAKILARIRELKVGPTDAVVFYYAGHGATDKKGHFLALGFKPGGSINRFYRDDLLTALKAKNARLTVLLTDCCSDRIDTKRSIDEPEPESRGRPHADAAKLFLAGNGLVDITASTNDKAYGTNIRGGCFTFALASVIGSDKNPPKSWPDVFERVKKETLTVHKKQIDRGFLEAPEAGHGFQVPKAFSLPKVPVAEPVKESEFAVVSLFNPTEEPVKLSYRWVPGGAWVELTVPSKGRKVVVSPTEPGKALPKFEVKMPDAAGEFEAKRWKGKGTPGFEDGKIFKVTPPR